jgi:glycine cleavage system H protein
VRARGDDAVVGLTDHAQRAMGDVVYVDLVASHTRLHTMEVMGEVESIKVVFELRAPFTASIASVNGALWDEPELVNSDPYGEGWLVTLWPERPHDLFALLDAPAYAATLPDDAARPTPPDEDERARLWHPDVGGAEWVCLRRVASGDPDAPRVCLMAYDGWSQSEHAASALSRWRVEENRFGCTVADALSLLELSGFQRLPRGRLDEPTP